MSNGETRSHTKVIIAYAFFEYYRNQKNFELSGKYLTTYNDLQYNLREFDINKEVHFFKRIKQATSTSKFQPKIKEDPIKPIFIRYADSSMTLDLGLGLDYKYSELMSAYLGYRLIGVSDNEPFERMTLHLFELGLGANF